MTAVDCAVEYDVDAIAAQRVLAVVHADASADALDRVDRALRYLLIGGRLDVAADDLRWAADRLTVVVERQLATAGRVLGWDGAAE